MINCQAKVVNLVVFIKISPSFQTCLLPLEEIEGNFFICIVSSLRWWAHCCILLLCDVMVQLVSVVAFFSRSLGKYGGMIGRFNFQFVQCLIDMLCHYHSFAWKSAVLVNAMTIVVVIVVIGSTLVVCHMLSLFDMLLLRSSGFCSTLSSSLSLKCLSSFSQSQSSPVNYYSYRSYLFPCC